MKWFIASFAIALLASLSSADAADPRDEFKLSGAYVMVAGEKSGEEIPADRVEGVRVVFTGDRIITSDKDEKETYVATYVLDTSKEPFGIMMTSVKPQAGETAMGLVKSENGKLYLIYALPGGERPTDFKTKDKQHLFVLEESK